MTDLAKLPVTVITGFLGAGKTTLITHLMQNPGGKRLAVIVNEFGDVGVDGDILKSCAIPNCPAENILELANGCICCTVADDFVPTMEKLLSRETPPDHIVIETSGLALPQPLVRAFTWPDIRTRGRAVQQRKGRRAGHRPADGLGGCGGCRCGYPQVRLRKSEHARLFSASRGFARC